MPLKDLPRIDRLELAKVTRVPEWHPEHATFTPFPVYAWVVHHPDGVILVDTGIGSGDDRIDGWYAPETLSIVTALEDVGVGVDDVTAVVLSHLHFDHCGQHALFTAPVHVSRDEHSAAQEPYYTIREWASIPDSRLRLVDGDETIAEGVGILATPGHTPGHQSVVVTAGSVSVVLGGQCAYRASEILTGEPGDTNLHAPEWRDAARDSIARIRASSPCEVHLSHDPTIVRL